MWLKNKKKNGIRAFDFISGLSVAHARSDALLVAPEAMERVVVRSDVGDRL